jgi:hypothetical protein
MIPVWLKNLGNRYQRQPKNPAGLYGWQRLMTLTETVNNTPFFAA